MDKKPTVALIGVGHMGSMYLKLLEELQKNNKCSLIAVCDTDEEVFKRLSENLSIPMFLNLKEMVEKVKFDAAIIATISSSHFEVAKLLIESGIKYLLIEKPVVTNIEDLKKLKDITEKNDVLISAGFTEVYNSVSQGLQQYVRKNTLKYINFSRIGLWSPKNNEKDIDVLQDIFIHDLAVLNMAKNLNDVAEKSIFMSDKNPKTGFCEFSTVKLVFKDGSVANFVSDRNGAMKIREVEVLFQDFYGIFDYMEQTAKIYRKGEISPLGDKIWYSQSYNGCTVRYVNNPLMDEIIDFINVVAGIKDKTLTSEHWYECTEFVEQLRRSSFLKSKEKELKFTR